MLNLVVDRIVAGQAYPTLQAYPRKDIMQPWAQTYPYTQTIDLIAYCDEFDVAYDLYTVENYPRNESTNYYTVHIGWFDFTIDYISLLPETVYKDVGAGLLKILFYYHEGDDPNKIKLRLDQLCSNHKLNDNIYRFVSGNTQADIIDRFVYFCDHDYLYYIRNKMDEKILKTSGSPMRTFTALVRTHKWWRATALADLYRRGLLSNSYWSYNTKITVDEDLADCPIRLAPLAIRQDVHDFVADGPYRADELNPTEHNDHSITVMEHYTNSYCNIVFETLFDADGSGGAFLTEKTFKPIKHGQPFVIAGCAGSLQLLRDLGYRVFDGIIDNTYDTIPDNTQRWMALRHTIQCINDGDLEQFRTQCRADVEHNQQLFLTGKQHRLNMLIRKISNDQ